MSHLRNLASLAAAIGALSYTSVSRADVTSTTVTNQPQPQQPQTTVVQPAPQPPSQIVTVQPAPPPPATTTPTGTTTTTAAPYAPPPAGGEQYAERSVEHRPNKTLLRTGIGIFAVSYVSSGIAGLASTRDADGFLLVPLVGPWIDLANRGCSDRPCGDRENTNRAAIVTAGIFQTVGALLTVGSFLIPEGTTVTHEQRVVSTKPEVTVTPVSFADGGGLGAVGRF